MNALKNGTFPFFLCVYVYAIYYLYLLAFFHRFVCHVQFYAKKLLNTLYRKCEMIYIDFNNNAP